MKVEVTAIYEYGKGIVPTYRAKPITSFYANPNAYYGLGVWEGMRCNNGNIFRLNDHVHRLIKSARIMNLPFPRDDEKSEEEIKKGILSASQDHIKKTGEKGFYIRPWIYYTPGEMGLDQSANTTEFSVAAWPWEHYHKANVVESGIEVVINPFTKIHGDPSFFKSKNASNYGFNSREKTNAKKGEYHDKSFDDTIFLDKSGFVAEATGANIFFVEDNFVHTPSSEMPEILNGITRDSIIQLLRYAGVDVKEALIQEQVMYGAKESFITGTATRVAPVTKITDRTGLEHVIGDGKPGKVTKLAYDLYVKAIYGELKEFGHWLTKVE